MSTSSDKDLKGVFKQAAEIASQVPEKMQEAAFNRALDLLTGAGSVTKRKSGGTGGGKRRVSDKDAPSQKAMIDTLLLNIDSTRYPKVKTAKKALDQSLMILQVALNDHDIDGLTPGEISKILKEKFRVGTTAAAVRMALKDVSNLVDRIAEGQGYRYKIMSPGEDYLANLLAPDDPPNPGVSTSRKRKARSRGSKNGKKGASVEGEDVVIAKGTGKKTTSSRSTQATGKIGPKTAVVGLIDSGFFDTPQTGPEVKEHLKRKKGFDLGVAQLSLAMLRLVRDGALERDENDEGHYEYKRP